MIKITYDINLTEDQFKALKEMVQQHYLKSENCSVSESNIYDLFQVVRYASGGEDCCARG